MGADTDKREEGFFQQGEDVWHRYEENTRMIGASAPFGIYLIDIKGQCRYVNHKWCEMAGMRPEEALGDGWVNAFHPEDRERVKAQWYRFDTDQWGKLHDFRFQTPKGKVTWIAGYATKIRDEQNAVIGYFGVNVNVTTLKNVEAALRASEERYRTTIDAMDDGIYVLDSDLKITLNNSTIARWAQEMGQSGILVGKTPFKALPFLPENVADEYHRVFQTGDVLITNEESRYANRNKYFEVRKIPIFEGGEVSHIATVIRDISKQMQAEKALKESEERFRSIYDQSPVAIELYDMDGHLIDANPACLDLFGIDSIDDVKGFKLFDDPNLLENAKKDARLGKAVQYEIPFDFDLVREMNLYKTSRSGTCYLDCLITPWTGSDSTPDGYLVHLRDITHRKQAEEMLRRQAREMDALQKTVLEIVEPHELSTLLPTIVERAVQLLGGAEGGLYLSDREKKEVRCVVSYNTKRDYTGTVLSFGEGAAGTVAQNGEALLIDDYRVWPGRASVFESEQPFMSIVSVPLWWQEYVIGVLHVLNDVEGETFSQADQDLLSTFAAHAAMAVGKAETREQAKNEITERKKAEAALSKSERLYRNVLTSISDAVFITDTNGDFTFVCENVDITFGYTYDEVEIIGNIYKLLGARIIEYEQILDEEEIVNIEHEIIDKMDRRHNLLINVKKVDIDDGKMLFTCHDITERKRTEDILAARLRISEFAPHHSQDDLLQLTLDEAERLTASSIGFLHFVDDDQINLHLQMWSTNTLTTMCTIDEKELHYPVDEAGVWVDCLLQKKPVIHNDYEALTHKKGYPEGHAPVTRELTVPVIVEDKVKAIIGVGNKDIEYDEDDVQTVSSLAHMVWDIIERKQAEEALRESQKNLQAILDANLDSAFLIEPDGRIVTCNETLAKRFGKEKDDLIGINIYDLFNVEVAESRRRYGEQVVASGEAVRFEDERSGRAMDNSIYPVFDDTGRVKRLAIYSRDFTEQKQAEQEIWKTKTLLERTYASLDQAVFVIDKKDRKVLSCNQAAENIFGFSEDEMIGHTTEFMYVDRASYDDYFPEVRSGLDADGIYRTEMQMRRKDGTHFCAEVTDTELLDESGHRTGVVSVIRDVTEQKRAATELSKLKNYLHCTLDGLVESVALLDEQGEILLVNQAWREFARNNGASLKDVCEGVNYFSACKTITGEWLEDAKPFAEGLSKILSGELDTFSFEYPCHSPDEKRWFFAHMTLNEFAGIRYIVVAHQNITVQKHAQRKIRESEERYRLLAENSTDVIALYDGDYNPLYISPSSTRLSGHSMDDFKNRSIFDFIHPDDKPGFLEAIKRDVQQKKKNSRYEFRYKRKDGKYIWVETISNRSFDEENNVTQILSNVRDISERVEAKMELQKTAEILQEAQKVARLGHWEWNPQTNEVSWSDEIFRILGYDPRTTPADFKLWFDMIHPSDVHIANQYIEDTLKGIQERSTEYRIVRKDDEIRQLLIKGIATLDKHNQPVRILGIMQDITERAQVEQEKEQLLEAVTQQREELRALNVRAAEADEIERRRIAKELHDQIGQNMSALSINLNIVQSRVSEVDTDLVKKIDDSLNLVDETTDNIRKVMSDLHPTVLDDYGLLPALNWLAERIEDRTGLQIDVRSSNFKKERLDPKVEMQLFRITQEALNNVTRHARATKVKISLNQLKHFLQLSIADNGTGFEVEDQQESEDRGWGLRIMGERAESIGGRFRVESARPGPLQSGKAGNGSKVVVELDIKP